MPVLKWYGTKKNTHQKVVRQPGMRAATHAAALIEQGKAEARLAPHHANNAADPRPSSYVTTSQGTVDAFVNLHDPDGGALPIAISLDVFGGDSFPHIIGGKRKRIRNKKKRPKSKKEAW